MPRPIPPHHTLFNDGLYSYPDDPVFMEAYNRLIAPSNPNAHESSPHQVEQVYLGWLLATQAAHEVNP